jgi:lysophospholipase L1-like esterase
MRLSIRSVAALAAAIGLFFAIVTVAQAETSYRARLAQARAVVQPPGPAPPGTRVVVLGDSITHLSEDAFAARFASRGFIAPVISGVNGIRSDERISEGATLLRPVAPDVVVIELGTNDVGWFLEQHPNATADEREAHARRVADNQRRLADAAGAQARCIVVVTVSGNTLSPPANQVARDEDRALSAWARTDPRVRVADWDSLLSYEFALGEPSGSMTTDTVHPTPYGATRLADLVTSTIDSCPLG